MTIELRRVSPSNRKILFHIPGISLNRNIWSNGKRPTGVDHKGHIFSEVVHKKHNLKVYANYVQCKLTSHWTVVLAMIRFSSLERDYSLSSFTLTGLVHDSLFCLFLLLLYLSSVIHFFDSPLSLQVVT